MLQFYFSFEVLTATNDLDDEGASEVAGQRDALCGRGYEGGVLQGALAILVHGIEVDGEVHGIVEVKGVARLAHLGDVDGSAWPILDRSAL